MRLTLGLLLVGGSLACNNVVFQSSDTKKSNSSNSVSSATSSSTSSSTTSAAVCDITCLPGLSLDSSTCTCVQSTSSGSNSGGSGGSAAFPPSVSALWPGALVVGTGTGTSCTGAYSGANAIQLLIQNDPSTSASSNQYSTPIAAPLASVTSVSTPAQVSGVGIVSNITFSSFGTTEVATGTSAEVARVQPISGTGAAVDYTTVGAGTAAASAGWKNPAFAARDRYGNIYITDGSGAGATRNTIRVLCLNVVDPDLSIGATTAYNHWCVGKTAGNVYTIVGDPTQTAGNSADATAVATALLSAPRGVAVDEYNNIYWADSGNNVVKVACAATQGYCSTKAADKIYQVASGFSSPIGIDLQSNTTTINIIVADRGNHLIKAYCGFSGTAGPCFAAVAGSTITVAGTTNGYAGDYASDGGALASTKFSSPSDVKINWNGNVFIADAGNNRVRALCYSGSAADKDLCNSCGANCVQAAPKMVLLAGTGTGTDTGDGASGRLATVTQPWAIDIGKRWATDTTNSSFRDNNIVILEKKTTSGVSPSAGNVVRVLCGNNSSSSSTGWCPGQSEGVIMKIAGTSGSASTVSSGYGAATSVAFAALYGMTYDEFKNLIVTSRGYADFGAASGSDEYKLHAIVTKTSASPGNSASVMGTGSAGTTGNGAAASAAAGKFPTYATRDRYGNLYFSDGNGTGTTGHVVRVICYDVSSAAPPNGYNYWCNGKTAGYVYLLAGDPTANDGFAGNDVPAAAGAGNAGPAGAANSVRFSSPRGLAVDRYGNVVVADSGNHVIRVICGSQKGICAGMAGVGIAAVSATGNILTIGGSAGVSNSTDNANWLTARFNTPYGLDLEEDGTNMNIYVADSGNHRIRAMCSYDPGKGPCKGVAVGTATPAGSTSGYAGQYSTVTSETNSDAGTLGITKFNTPLDVKINWNGNLFISDYGNNRLRAICYTGGTSNLDNDPCKTCSTNCDQTATSAKTILLASHVVTSSSAFGTDTGDGGQASAATMSLPIQLMIAKRWASDLSVLSLGFRDANIGFVERRSAPASTAAGNVVRMICGDNSLQPSFGYCGGLAAGTIQRIGGTFGTTGTTSGSGISSLSVAYGGAYGLSYDLSKNIWVTTTGDALWGGSTSTNDYGIRVLKAKSTGRVAGIRYTFTDSNQLSSTYCLRLRVQTQCYLSSCTCEALPGGSSGQPFWEQVVSSTTTCP